MRTVKYWRLVRSLHDFLSNIGDLSICLHDIVSNMIARPHISGFASHHPHHHQILYLNSIIIQNNSLGVVKWSIILKPLTEINKNKNFRIFEANFTTHLGYALEYFHIYSCVNEVATCFYSFCYFVHNFESFCNPCLANL